jgi:hypothetical protein
MTDFTARLRQLTADLAPLEIEWEPWEWGRFEWEGIQHVRRDGSVIVVTDNSDPDAAGDDRWLVGFYTADQFAAPGLHGDDIHYAYCEDTSALLLTIITEGQSRDSGSPWRLTGETDAAYAERSLKLGTIQP